MDYMNYEEDNEQVNLYDSQDLASKRVQECKLFYGKGVSLLLTIENQSDTNVYLFAEEQLKGDWFQSPKNEIPPKNITVSLFAQPKGQPRGCKGTIKFVDKDNQQTWDFSWHVPVWKKVIGGKNKFETSSEYLDIIQPQKTHQSSPHVHIILKKDPLFQ